MICVGGVHGRWNRMKIPSESPEYNSFNTFPMVTAWCFVPVNGLIHCTVGQAVEEEKPRAV